MVEPQQSAGAKVGATDDIEVRLGANLVHLPVVRAIAMNIAMRADFDMDAISDLELAVDESCSTLITRAVADSLLACQFTIGADEIVFAASVMSHEDTPPSTSTFGWRVLTTLTDSVVGWVEPGDEPFHTVHVELVKRRPVVAG